VEETSGSQSRELTRDTTESTERTPDTTSTDTDSLSTEDTGTGLTDTGLTEETCSEERLLPSEEEE